LTKVTDYVEPVTATAPALGRPHLLRQRWCELTFLHWAVEPGAVRHLFPPGVRPDVLDGMTYVGLIPFRMVGTGLAHGPAVPWFGTLLETNVRLCSVDTTGRRGIVFLSLDANRLAVVVAGRSAFGLPYRWARLHHHADGDLHTYKSARYRIQGRAGGPVDGPLERFLTARWGLHVRHLGRTWYLPTDHPPWALRSAELLHLDESLLASHGLHGLFRPPDHVAFSNGVPVVFGAPVPAYRPRS
jgi:uncharacterized protein YqjF (DUF2071 family)